VQSNWTDALYGLTLVCIKLGQAADAIKYIKIANALEGEKAAPHIKYALALAYRTN
jgi:hypothetical protein